MDDVRPESIVFVGDLFTKGPDPCGVFRRVEAWSAHAVLGNHDAAMLEPRLGSVAEACARRMDLEVAAWRGWTAGLPLFLEVAGFTVVHAGLHPSGDLASTTRHRALHGRRWPDDTDLSNPFWYDVYTGSRRVVFGHDARRGMVRRERDGAPWLIGLDTGCVYGGALSGYIPEEDRVVQVAAHRVYRPV